MQPKRAKWQGGEQNGRQSPLIFTDSAWLLDQGHPVWGSEIKHSIGWMVEEAIEQLPERHKAVVQLRLYAQWTFQAIADEVGMPGRNYAQMYWKRGLKKIRDYILAHEDTPDYLKEDT